LILFHSACLIGCEESLTRNSEYCFSQTYNITYFRIISNKPIDEHNILLYNMIMVNIFSSWRAAVHLYNNISSNEYYYVFTGEKNQSYFFSYFANRSIVKARGKYTFSAFCCTIKLYFIFFYTKSAFRGDGRYIFLNIWTRDRWIFFRQNCYYYFEFRIAHHQNASRSTHSTHCKLFAFIF